MKHCLYMAGLVFFGTFGLVAGLFLLFWLARPIKWLIKRYWDWVDECFDEGKPAHLAVSVTPIVAFLFAFLAFVICLMGP